MNILEVKRSCSHLLEKSIATSFLFVYNAHICCICLDYVFIVYLFHCHTDVVVGLLITSSMYICVSVAFVFIVLNVKRHKLVSICLTI